MAKDFNLCVKTYDNIKGKTIRVYACYNDVNDYEKGRKPEFYDIYEDNGTMQTCLNEGEPFYKKPTKGEIEDLVEVI
jgi:hypothetical protein